MAPWKALVDNEMKIASRYICMGQLNNGNSPEWPVSGPPISRFPNTWSSRMPHQILMFCKVHTICPHYSSFKCSIYIRDQQSLLIKTSMLYKTILKFNNFNSFVSHIGYRFDLRYLAHPSWYFMDIFLNFKRNFSTIVFIVITIIILYQSSSKDVISI